MEPDQLCRMALCRSGTQYDTTINEWHTCPEGGPIRASNPCSEYMFLDNTACNLASVNLRKFFDENTNTFDVRVLKLPAVCGPWCWRFRADGAVPVKEVAQLSYDYRTPRTRLCQPRFYFDGERYRVWQRRSRGIAGAITAIMTGIAYKTSAEMARFLGAFDKMKKTNSICCV